MPKLTGVRVAVLATDGFEESELLEPVKALKEAGATVSIVSLKSGSIQGMNHHEKSNRVPVDREITSVSADEFDAVVLPGGALNADAMRVNENVLAFLKSMDQAGKPIASICHAMWELISAGLVRGRTLTSYHTIRDDIVNSGGIWFDMEVVEDKNWVTSRKPADLPAFNKSILRKFEECCGTAVTR